MALPTPKLDDRTFQDLVDEAKRLIPQYCPGWTDHNVSDPGITLIELFAYMTEQYLYRLNQVPEKNYVAFLNLLGGLKPPRAARGAVTFTLASALGPNAAPFNIPQGTELATVRTETEEAIVFTTDRAAQAMPAKLAWILTAEDRDKDDWNEQKNESNSSFPAWPHSNGQTAPFPAVALGFENDLSAHALAFIIECEKIPEDDNCQWQVYRGAKAYDNSPWVTLEVAADATNNLSQSWKGILYLPDYCLAGKLGTYEARIWVRCSPRDPQPTTYSSPKIKAVKVETRGITAPVTQAQVIENEVIGTSDGQPGESFSLLYHPILEPRDPDDGSDIAANADEWVVEAEVKDNPNNDNQWKAVDRSLYRIDPIAGMVEFAPDRVSVVPTRERRIRVRRYRTSGGDLGNVSAGKVSVLKTTSLPGIKSVTNRLRISGGRAAQTLEDAKLRSPARERLRQRAVTTEDFEILAQQVPGVGGVRCLPDQNGNVKLLVIPDLPRLDNLKNKDLDEYIRVREGWGKQYRVDLAIQELTVPIETKDRLWAAMQPRLLLGSTVTIEMPSYDWVRVEVIVKISKMASLETSTRVIQDVKRRLYGWFHPLYGGVGGKGWQVKQPLREDKVWMLISGTSGIEDIVAINLFRYQWEQDQKKYVLTLLADSTAPRPITFIPAGVIACVDHRVEIDQGE